MSHKWASEPKLQFAFPMWAETITHGQRWLADFGMAEEKKQWYWLNQYVEAHHHVCCLMMA